MAINKCKEYHHSKDATNAVAKRKHENSGLPGFESSVDPHRFKPLPLFSGIGALLCDNPYCFPS